MGQGDRIGSIKEHNKRKRGKRIGNGESLEGNEGYQKWERIVVFKNHVDFNNIPLTVNECLGEPSNIPTF